MRACFRRSCIRYHGFRYIRVDVRPPPSSSSVDGGEQRFAPGAFATAPITHGLFMRSDVTIHGAFGAVAGGDADADSVSALGLPVPGVDATKWAALATKAPSSSSSLSQPRAAVADVLSAVQRCVVQTQIDNIHSHPTDCPQREKRGWMGDAQWTAEEATINLDMGGLYVIALRCVALFAL